MSERQRGDWLFGDRSPDDDDGDRFRGREELVEENARLRAELERWREENELLADMLADQFDEDTGEIHDEEPEGAREGAAGDQTRFASNFVISDAAIDLFEELPARFTLDEVFEAAESLGQRASEVADHARAYLRERMVVQEEQQFVKTGRKPYF